jgi:phage terminase small subunit
MSRTKGTATMPVLSNPRWEAFCQAYACGEHAGNARACYRATYRKDNRQAASRLRQRDDIVQRVAEIRAEITAQEGEATRQATEALGISKEWVLEKLVENVERSMQHKAVLDEDGAPVGEYKYDATAANKALELLGKHLGMFVQVEPRDLNVNLGLEVIDRPPRETREQWVERRRRELEGNAAAAPRQTH